MGTFVTQETEPTVFTSKETAPGAALPAGLTYQNVWRATDANTVKDALLDVRSELRGQVVNVKHLGAIGDGVTDDRTAIQNALDYAAGDIPVYFPEGDFRVSGPLHVSSPGQVIYGSGYRTTVIQPTSGSGTFPIFSILSQWSKTPPIGAALLTGTGASLQLSVDTNNYPWLDLRDTYYMELNGLTALTVECTFQPTSLATNGYILGCSGRETSNYTTHVTYSLRVTTTGQVIAELDVAGTSQIITSAAGVVVVGQTHHIELSYNGTTVRLFVDGVSVGTPVAASGGIVQTQAEHAWVGYAPAFPEWNASASDTAVGYVTGIRVSNTARHTAGFTKPTAYLTYDSNTLSLCNFNTVDHQYVVGTEAGGSPVWMLWRDGAQAGHGGAGINSVTIRDLEIDGSYGIITRRLTDSTFENITMLVSRAGFTNGNNCYQNVFRDCNVVQFANLGRWGILIGTASGLCRIQRGNVTSSGYNVCLLATATVEDVYLDGPSQADVLINCGENSHAVVNLVGVVTTDEDTVTGGRASILSTYVRALKMTACQLARDAHDTKQLILNNVDGLELDTCMFSSKPAGTEALIHVESVSPGSQRPVVKNSHILNGGTVRCNLDNWIVWGDQQPVFVTGPDAVPTTGTWVAGRDVLVHDPPTSGAYIGRVPTDSGTAGTYSGGLTGQSLGGAAIYTHGYPGTDLQPGMYLNLSGGGLVGTQKVKILAIAGTALTLDAVVPVADPITIAYANPTFKTWGPIS